MNKTLPFILSSALAGYLGLSGAAQADCSAFMANAQAAPGGAVPRLDESGNLASIVVYGEDTFLAPKRSLVGRARSGAELAAKRAFVEWLEGENFSAEEAAQDMLEVVEVTNQEGETSGLAQEISSYVETMRSNTGATISALAKLDECVDTEGKFVMVELGWKPEFSSAARGAAAEMQAGASAPASSEPQAPAEAEGLDLTTKSKIDPVEGYRIKSPLKDQF